MAGTIVPASPLITRLERQSLGDVGATLSNFDNDNEPQIIGTFEIAGSLGSFASLESITGWAALSNGTVYIKVVPDTTAGTCTAEFTATAPTWDNAKMGWYGTGANANHRYLFKLTKGGASLWSDKSFLEVYGKYQNVTVENDLTVGGAISGSSIETDGTALKTKIIELGDWNMDATSNIGPSLLTYSINGDNIRSVSVAIRADAGLGGAVRDLLNAGTVGWSTNALAFSRTSGGEFDNTDFDQTSYNRGWATIVYEA